MTTSQMSVSINAPNEWQLLGTIFEATDNPSGPAILISGAAAIPQGFYAEFAKSLIEKGARAVLMYDYRGMGKSAGSKERWPELKMKDWAVLDFPAAAHFLKDRFPDNPLIGIGHSYGGQALGLSGVSHLFQRYVTVATMSGYWKGTDEPIGVWLKTQLIGKCLAKVMGRVPKWGGLGSEMPGSIFLDWGRWIASPDYFFSDPHTPEVSKFSDVTIPYLAIGISDDHWATKRAVDSFMRHYKNADLQTLWLTPDKGDSIGHFSYFRPRHAHYWNLVSDFVFTGVWPDEAESYAS